MKTLKYLTVAANIFLAHQTFASDNSLISDIFSFDHPIYAKGCHTRLTGESKTGYKWELSDVQLVDIDYHVKAFRNETLMFQYGTGLPREPQATADRIVGTWMNRFLNGNPHGGMTIFNAETRERIGHIVAGGGDRPGISEIAYTLMEDSWDGRDVPKIWGKGVMSGVVGSIVNDWAPEVIRLSESNMPVCIQKAFTCFGGKPLEGFDATASPSNPGSWCVLKKHGFKAAITNVDCGETVADFDGKELEPSEFENELMKLYTVDTILETPLERGIRYHVIGTDGTLHTVSHHKNFNRMKLHLELKF